MKDFRPGDLVSHEFDRVSVYTVVGTTNGRVNCKKKGTSHYAAPEYLTLLYRPGDYESAGYLTWVDKSPRYVGGGTAQAVTDEIVWAPGSNAQANARALEPDPEEMISDEK